MIILHTAFSGEPEDDDMDEATLEEEVEKEGEKMSQDEKIKQLIAIVEG